MTFRISSSVAIDYFRACPRKTVQNCPAPTQILSFNSTQSTKRKNQIHPFVAKSETHRPHHRRPWLNALDAWAAAVVAMGGEPKHVLVEIARRVKLAVAANVGSATVDTSRFNARIATVVAIPPRNVLIVLERVDYSSDGSCKYFMGYGDMLTVKCGKSQTGSRLSARCSRRVANVVFQASQSRTVVLS
ncbi:hypothetical protein BST61_g9704 [Cercospora zeina]